MANRYRVAFAPAARREFAKLAPAVQIRIQTAVDRLRGDPIPAGVEQLKGPDALLRIRVGDYRIIYRVFDEQLLVLVLRTAHRSEAYRAAALRLVRRRKR